MCAHKRRRERERERGLVFLFAIGAKVRLVFSKHPPISQGLQAGSRAVWVAEVSANLP